MKIVISIPDEIFEAGERLCHRLEISRNQLYTRALANFLARHDEEQITAALNRVLDTVDVKMDNFSRKAANQTLKRAEW